MSDIILPSTLDPLPRDFFAQPVLQVARECVGKLLISRIGGVEVISRIVETEAYRGPDDRAAHSYRGRRSIRTEVMFGPAGHAYVFTLYGIHAAFNLVTGQLGEPEAVLVRAVEPLRGFDHIVARRGSRRTRFELTNGPGKLCEALGITKQHNGVDVTQGELTLAWAPRVNVKRSPRIGIDYAGAWAQKPWRFFEPENPFVSRVPKRNQ
ncbi:MAG TPA: DNA-3-methyladenine glycosylase [Polyangiaceae bacterium]|nr:DNA-3-methyladenine glycosylase [Polyangiaceae bacterium]